MACGRRFGFEVLETGRGYLQQAVQLGLGIDNL